MIESQEALELEMYNQGKQRMQAMIKRNEDESRATMNPYAQAILRRFVLPLAEFINEDAKQHTARYAKAHVALLQPLDPEAVAAIAVRTTLTYLLNVKAEDQNARGAMLEIGRQVYHEYLLSIFADSAPDLFYALVNDFERRHTGQEHRLTVFKHSAKANGVEWNEWSIGAREQVGAYLLSKMAELGMVELAKVGHFKNGKTRIEMHCTLNPDVLTMIQQIKDLVSELSPMFQPCVAPPKDWTSFSDGGFHTKEMRRVNPFCVKARPGARDAFYEADMPVVLGAINALQAVRWRINERMLNTLIDVARHFDMDEIISQAELPRPTKPEWLESGMKAEDMTEVEAQQFRQWKWGMAEWHTEMKLRGTKVGRFYSATRIAQKFRNEEAIHFVYQADFRGRLYSLSTGVTPQGSDLQKCLLEFADGKAMLNDEARDFFMMAGANRYGFDKAPLADRVQWVKDRHDVILRIASDPISYRDWTEASSPLQFLAWCFEYKDWSEQGDLFKSRIAVGMDGSCNGLQNFSAMLRDEVGGRATNLIPSDKPNDIYQMVADVTARELALKSEDDEVKARYLSVWLAHGINRTLVKRSVMTLPYGSTRFSCSEFIAEDYLKKGKVPEFAKNEYRRSSSYLSYPVWDAIGEVVVKAREAMQWLQKSSALILKAGHKTIAWRSATGFPVSQHYWERVEHRINTYLMGPTKILVPTDSNEPHVRRHKNGIAPNFVHSYDASHLALTVKAASEAGIKSLAMIHDDYGTHAADAGVLYKIIRTVFVDMYENNDPLQQFADNYPDVKLPPLPAKGTLDLSVVHDSKYFFL